MRKAMFGATAAAGIALFTASTTYAADDAQKGAVLYQHRCASCHTLDPDKPSRWGPDLYGVVGRKVGALPSFHSYSLAMKQAGADGITWTPQNLDAYLTHPQVFLPRGTMPAGLKDEQDRADVIAYLRSVPEQPSNQ